MDPYCSAYMNYSLNFFKGVIKGFYLGECDRCYFGGLLGAEIIAHVISFWHPTSPVAKFQFELNPKPSRPCDAVNPCKPAKKGKLSKHGAAKKTNNMIE